MKTPANKKIRSPVPVGTGQPPQQQTPSEEQIQVVLGALERQRNQALAENVNMQVEMFVREKRIKQLETHIEAIGGKVPAIDAPPPAKSTGKQASQPTPADPPKPPVP